MTRPWGDSSMPRGRPRKTPESPAQESAAAQTSPTTTNGNSGNEALSKMDAMRQTLADLGKDAMPLQLQGHLKSKFGIDMPTSHISNYKSVILKPTPKKGKPGRKPKAAVQLAAPKGTDDSTGVSLDDILAVKQLTDRMGAATVRELADLFSE
jgi:hypothetical protein